jgi:hypothetical protein
MRRDRHVAADRLEPAGRLICGLFVTWYVVAGTATQAAFQSVFERSGYRFA